MVDGKKQRVIIVPRSIHPAAIISRIGRPMPFQVPEGPYSIERIMESIRSQIVDAPASKGESAPVRVHDGSVRSSRVASIEEMSRLAPLDVYYQIRSHRRLFGAILDTVKRLIHWGSRPYTDRIRERQAGFNGAVVAVLASISNELDRLDAGLGRHNAAINRLYSRHDLGPFLASIPPKRRLAGLKSTRGPADEIACRQAHYLEIFKGVPGPVLDIGCGRGEMLNLLRGEGIECRGAEIDPLMAEEAGSKGATVERIDGIEALRNSAPASLGGVFAAQVVEHLFPAELGELLTLAREKLACGGLIVLETVNVSSPVAMSKSFYGDMDHKLPLHPEYLKLLLDLAGFEDVELHFSAPFGPEERLADMPAAVEIGMTPEARDAMQDTITRLNDRLFGMQDYHVVGRQGMS